MAYLITTGLEETGKMTSKVVSIRCFGIWLNVHESLSASTHGLPAQKVQQELIYERLAFGDSYTYVQGTAGRQNYSFIGDAQDFSFAPEKLLSDEIVQNQVWKTQHTWMNPSDFSSLELPLVDQTGSNISQVASLANLQNAKSNSGTSLLLALMFRRSSE